MDTVIASATEEPRFEPLAGKISVALSIEISVLSPSSAWPHIMRLYPASMVSWYNGSYAGGWFFAASLERNRLGQDQVLGRSFANPNPACRKRHGKTPKPNFGSSRRSPSGLRSLRSRALRRPEYPKRDLNPFRPLAPLPPFSIFGL